MDRTLWRYVNLLGGNESHVEKEARSILISLCENILDSPEESRYRKLRLNDSATIKLLEAAGAIESLLECGFVEDDGRFFLPCDVPLNKLKVLHAVLITESLKLCTNAKTGYYVLLPVDVTAKERKIFTSIVGHYKSIMRYEEPELQEKARSTVPVNRLEIRAVERLRELQRNIREQMSQGNGETSELYPENKIFVKDIFLIELMHWFKNEFFQWFNKPTCKECSIECTYTYTATKHIKNEQIGRIEVYKCENCNKTESFIRYTDPEPLLYLRRGRCGEWANVFTCLCRTFGYDARLIQDHTDHLWTEVWSMTENRWIHVDPCEDTIDKPLMYEKGWHKKLNYIFAYSKDEVQDVTWRYTRDQGNVLARRTDCSEEDLAIFFQILNEQRQHTPYYSAARRRYVIKRHALDLATMLYLPGQQDLESEDTYEERSSGSYAWRLTRGEVTERNIQEDCTWYIPKNVHSYKLQYFIVKDVYKVFCDLSLHEERSSWRAGSSVIEGNIFRKVENDWKMVYLARSENSKTAEISWTFEVKDSNLCVDTFHLQAHTTVYHDAEISWEVEGDCDNESETTENVSVYISDSNNFQTNELKGATKIILRARLIGGEGDLAWQHAQLFRQRLQNEDDECMTITIQLCDYETR